MKRFLILVAAASTPSLAAATYYPSLEACRADQEATLASSQEAHRIVIDANPGGDIRNTPEYATWKRWQQRFEQVLEVCRDIEAAQRVKANAGDPNVSAEKAAGDLNDLHELLSNRVLGAVPNGTVRSVQEKNLSTVRGQMGALAGDLDAALGSLSAAGFSSSGRTSPASQQIIYSKLPGQAAQTERNAQAERARWSDNARIARQREVAAAQARALEAQRIQESAMLSNDYDTSEDVEEYRPAQRRKSFGEQLVDQMAKDVVRFRPLLEAKRAREAAARARTTTRSSSGSRGSASCMEAYGRWDCSDQ